MKVYLRCIALRLSEGDIHTETQPSWEHKYQLHRGLWHMHLPTAEEGDGKGGEGEWEESGGTEEDEGEGEWGGGRGGRGGGMGKEERGVVGRGEIEGEGRKRGSERGEGGEERGYRKVTKQAVTQCHGNYDSCSLAFAVNAMKVWNKEANSTVPVDTSSEIAPAVQSPPGP